jgi:XapX domain-containing protein
MGLVSSFVIGGGCRYFDIPAASPPVIPGALIVLAMTLGYTSMDRLVANKNPKAVDHQAFVRRTYRTAGDRESCIKGLR